MFALFQLQFSSSTPSSSYLNTHSKLAILLDYDGTLAPIADNPSKTKMPVELEAILHKLAKHPQIFLAVISGRALKDVQKMVNIDGVTYAGNHGLEIEYPDGSRHDYELPADIKKNYTAMVEELKQRVEKNGAWVEDKHVSLTYHYRDTPVELKDELKTLAAEICQQHGFRPNQAHEAIEAKPPVNWNKGEAALYILKSKFGADWVQEVLVVFAGDDTTDEDAMRVSVNPVNASLYSLNPNPFLLPPARYSRAWDAHSASQPMLRFKPSPTSDCPSRM